jgi:hypothetical protein
VAFVTKNVNRAQGSSTPASVLDQYIKVTQQSNAGSGVALPATTTGQLFRVYGGRILVKALIGEVTTVLQTQANNTKISSKALSNAGVAVGTAVDVASNLDTTAIEVGGFLFVEGDGTALVKSTAGAVLVGTNSGWWIAPQGEIYVTTAATSTGAIKWDLYYQPLDPGAYAVQAQLTAAGILQAAI